MFLAFSEIDAKRRTVHASVTDADFAASVLLKHGVGRRGARGHDRASSPLKSQGSSPMLLFRSALFANAVVVDDTVTISVEIGDDKIWTKIEEGVYCGFDLIDLETNAVTLADSPTLARGTGADSLQKRMDRALAKRNDQLSNFFDAVIDMLGPMRPVAKVGLNRYPDLEKAAAADLQKAGFEPSTVEKLRTFCALMGNIVDRVDQLDAEVAKLEPYGFPTRGALHV